MRGVSCIIVVMSITLIITGCENSQIPELKFGFDENLVGDWLYVPVLNEGSAPYADGIRILDTGEIRGIAIEWETGILKESWRYNGWPDRGATVVFSNDGEGVLRFRHWTGSLLVEGGIRPANLIPIRPYNGDAVFQYRVSDHDLQFDTQGYYFRDSYKRCTVGTVEFEPVINRFEVQMNGGTFSNTVFTNRTLSTHPSAVVQLVSLGDREPSLWLSAAGSGETYNISIQEFDGPGTYPFDPVTAHISYGAWGGCMMETILLQDRSGVSGSITIDQLGDGRCTGSLEVNMIQQLWDATEATVRVTGQFDLPLYSH